MNRALLPLAVSALLLAGCARATASGDRSLSPDRHGSGIVFTGDQLFQTRSDLLTVLASRISNAQLVQIDGCTTMQFRGRKSLFFPVAPAVYIDGQHTSSACVLGMLGTADVSRVEVYPMGVTTRPGYYSNSGGLILVFLKDGPEDDVY